MQVIESSVRAGKNICCEAPNGFGKTCVTLCSVLPWVKENKAKMLYCARTHRQLDRVMEELDAISGRHDVTGISFRGRQHMCLNQFVLENADFVAPLSEVCGQLKATGKCAYHEHMKKLIASDDPFEDMPKRILTASDVVGIAKGWSVCPYEMAKSLARGADVVALSYLYVFDPFIFESFMPDLGVPMSKVVLIEDEAHNVPFTALDSASDSLPVGTVRQAMKEAETYSDPVSRVFCRGLAKVILEISSGMEENEERTIKPTDIYNAAVKASELAGETQIVSHMAETGLKIKKGLLRAGKLPRSAIHRVAEFLGKWLRCAERDDYAFIIASERGTGDSRKVSLDLLALDPTSVTSPILKLVHSSVAVSGTLSPLDAYTDMLGLGPETVKVAFQSPFGAESRLGIIVEGLDTSYEGRNETLFQHMVEHCVAVVNATPGNTGVFASSYSIAESLLKAGLEKKLNRRLFVERQGMKTSENDIMIEDFKSRGDKGGAVLLGVQGGRNSEGGDFPGPAMESVVVVGVPYAKPTPRTEALIEYFDRRFNGRGRQYAYVLPSMTRAIQAAGRPVRRPSDRGVIVFLDKRFATRYLRRFMPSWLDKVTRTMPDDPSAVAEQVAAFFSN